MAGHIKKRGKESWSVVIDLGKDPLTGRRRQVRRAVKGTKREAEALLAQLLYQRDQGIDAPPGKLTLGEYLELWLRDYGEARLAPSTQKRYAELLRIHVIPYLGSLPLAKLRPLHMQECYRQLLARGRAPRTVLQLHRVVREALQQALKWQLLPRNPADAVEPPSPARHQVPMLTLEAVGSLIEAAEASTPHGPLVRTAAMTGLRLGEVLGLRWQDLDLDGGVVYVRQALQWLSRQAPTFRQPKSHRGARPVAIGLSTIDRLRRHRREQLESRLVVGALYDDRDLVFAADAGGPLHPDAVRRAFRKAVKSAGLSPPASMICAMFTPASCFSRVCIRK